MRGKPAYRHKGPHIHEELGLKVSSLILTDKPQRRDLNRKEAEMNKMIVEELTRDDLIAQILRAKKRLGLSWADIAARIGMSPVWTHSAATGMNAFSDDKARAFAELLDLPHSAVDLLVESPLKHWDQTVPTDPCIYRLYEIVGVYGPTVKAMINEEFGNGIMSAIDFSMQVEREQDPKGDRVKITMSGKYLEYANW